MSSVVDNRYCIALHPISNHDYHHVADELLYRSDGGANHAEINDPLIATARACSAAFYEIGLQALVGERDLFLNVSQEWLQRPELMPLPPEQVVIELPIEMNADALDHLQYVKDQGYRLAIKQETLLQSPISLYHLIDIVKIDVRKPNAFEHLTYFRQQHLSLLAEFIESAERLAQCRKAPFDFYQGFFYGFPEQILDSTHSKRHSNRIANLVLIKELYAPEPDVNKIESLLVQDPHLCTLLFKRVNSASEKRAVKINSIHQAVVILGFKKMRALTATLLLSNNEPIKRLLVFKLLVRAAMAKKIALRVPNVDADVAFTAGLFSMIDRLEGVELNVLLKEAGLDTVITEALLEHKGELGKIVSIIQTFEAAKLDKRPLKFVEILNKDYLQSVAWAQEMMSLTDD